MKEEPIKVGQKVFIISGELKIEEREVKAIINEGNKLGFTLDDGVCGGFPEEEVFRTKSQAEVKLQDFMDGLKFKVGDLIVFSYKEYSRTKKTMGKIVSLHYSGYPYEVRGLYKEFDWVSREDALFKIKNEFIENYGNIQELYAQFDEKNKEIMQIIEMIRREHLKLERELEENIRNNSSIFYWNKQKRKFKDRFDYKEDDPFDY